MNGMSLQILVLCYCWTPWTSISDGRMSNLRTSRTPESGVKNRLLLPTNKRSSLIRLLLQQSTTWYSLKLTEGKQNSTHRCICPSCSWWYSWVAFMFPKVLIRIFRKNGQTK
ncbi:hypothetical protein BJ742DRAFT_293181 [Cladochytrium replicatum]|nr:hypothetical protein BJ742DRAFT_293181 [Cladochytrium replicatum]